ncbi:MAG: triphosphoribosyl-dephospho-CoA synthase [Rhizobiaceae bacterium]|nr:triphosphoribosyl-dephospho-CoA synthase [Rhizobiaceae bacterium]
MALSEAAISGIYLAACRAELDALKPGNVHRFAGGHGMDVAVFETSAAVSAPAISAANQPVGRRVLAAMEATWSAVGMNTNLGILLLCAPLAAAAEFAPPGSASPETRLRDALACVLGALTFEDAEDIFAAIALASPGGLGHREDHDVRSPPRISLMEAMRIASPTDAIASQYVRCFADIFDLGLPAIRAARAAGETEMWPAIACFLAFAADLPDSHVARKFGPARAEDLRGRMASAVKQLNLMGNENERIGLLLGFDAELKAEGLNPGTSADLTVASIFAERLVHALQEEVRG